MTDDQARKLNETHANTVTLMAMHKECHRERVANTQTLNGNGGDGLKSRVKVLEGDTGNMRADAKWVVRWMFGTLATGVIALLLWIFEHFSTVH